MIAAILFIVVFAGYLLTLSGTVPAYRDSGDMLNAIATLGIAHPPGYPLYVTAGKLFTDLLPFGNPAFRANIFSAACAAAAAVLLRVAVIPAGRKPGSSGVDGSKLIGFVVAIWFAITPAVLNLGRVSEMYAMAGLFASGILVCWIVNTPHSLLVGSLILGCGFGVHPTLLFLAPLLIPSRPSTVKEGLWQWSGQGLCFAMGFSVVLIPMVRSWVSPLQNWGNPATFTDLWALITRSNYGGLKLHPTESQFVWTAQGLWAQAVFFFRMLQEQWGWMGLGLGFFGSVAFFRADPKRGWRVGIAWLVAGPLFLMLSNLPLQAVTTQPILEPYFVIVNLLWAFLIAQGLWLAMNRLAAVPIRVAVVSVLLAVGLAESGRAAVSYRQHYYAYDLGRNIFRTLPPRAALYDPDDPISFTLRGLQLLENRRDDVALLNFFRTYWGYRQILDRWRDMLPLGPVFSADEMVRKLWTFSTTKRSFYVDLPMKLSEPWSYQVEGIVYSAIPAARPATPEELRKADHLWALYGWRGEWSTAVHHDFFTRQILNYRSAAYCNLGLKYAEKKDWARARALYDQALLIDPKLSAAYNNLGVADFEQGRYAEAVANYRLAVLYDPSNPGYQKNLEIALYASKNP